MAGDDLERIAQCRGGDRSAYDALYAAHAPRVAAYFLRSGFARADAEDLAQETFLRAFRSLASFDAERGCFGTWLAAIARNVARKRWSRRSEGENFDPDLAEDVLADPRDPTQTPEDREEQAALTECVGSLRGELARLVHLRYGEGRSTRGLSAATGLPESTVRLRLKEAQERLERCMKGKGFLR